jgi:hypothetical protein
MARVTDLNFYMDDMLKKKMDLLIKRCHQKSPKKDSLLLIEGGEGEGKSNLSFQIGYYVSKETGRPFSSNNVFFKAEDLLKFAQNTENQIIIYDEPSLDMMAAEWWKEEQMNIVKLLMTARKRRHFMIFNITKFYKFNEYIVVDRSLGMIHVYSRHEIIPGRFVYIKKKSIEMLYNKYRYSKKRLYKQFTSFRGSFPDFVPGIIDIDAYEVNKDKAIMSIGTKKLSREKIELLELKRKVGNLEMPILLKKDLVKKLGIAKKTLLNWAKSLGNEETRGNEN